MVLSKYAACQCSQIKCKQGHIWEGEMSESLEAPAQEPQWVVRMEGQGPLPVSPSRLLQLGRAQPTEGLAEGLAVLPASVCICCLEPITAGLIQESVRLEKTSEITKPHLWPH